MARVLTPDLCVIGAGSAGLTVAAGAAQMGAPTVLIEQGEMGGECLNTGCVPSKALLAAAKAAHAVRRAGRFGIDGPAPTIDFARVQAHVEGAIAAIRPHDSQERFEGLGVTVLRETARFTGPAELAAGDAVVRARRFVIATGSRPAVPPIPGLERVPYLTNETLFERRAQPAHLVVIGGGPIGLEMAQAHRRLGSQVTVLERAALLPKDDPELVEVVRRAVRRDGVELHEGAEVIRAEPGGNGIAVAIRQGEGEVRIDGSDLLVAVGRRPNIEGLDLERAGVAAGARGIAVDDRLRTSNPGIFAIGDVTGGLQFTHKAAYDAGIVLRNALFRLPAKVRTDAFPWVTYTDPELAQVGLTETEARERHGQVRVLRWPLADNDRAQAEGETEGLVKVITGRGGRVLGASIVGPGAGELIQLWVLVLARGLKIGAVANMIAPYPTLGEASKRAAGAYYAPTLFGGRTRRLVRFLSWFG